VPTAQPKSRHTNEPEDSEEAEEELRDSEEEELDTEEDSEDSDQTDSDELNQWEDSEDGELYSEEEELDSEDRQHSRRQCLRPSHRRERRADGIAWPLGHLTAYPAAMEAENWAHEKTFEMQHLVWQAAVPSHEEMATAGFDSEPGAQPKSSHSSEWDVLDSEEDSEDESEDEEEEDEEEDEEDRSATQHDWRQWRRPLQTAVRAEAGMRWPGAQPRMWVLSTAASNSSHV